MRRRFLTSIVCLMLAGLATLPAPAVSARPRAFNALVFADRDQPETFVPVSDLVVNDTITNPDGDRFFVLNSPQGTFQLAFDAVADVEFTRYLGAVRPDTVRYEVRVVLPAQGIRRGTIDLRVLRGFAHDGPWHALLVTRPDRGAGLHRILFVGSY